MDLFDLRGRSALITGGNGGIGLGIAHALASAGAAVTIAGRNADKNEAALRTLEQQGYQASALIADVTDSTQVGQLVAEAQERMGGLDILVANAGTNIRRQPQDYSVEEWRHILDTNLSGVFHCCQAVYPALKQRGGGKILTIGSMTSLFGFGVGPVYAAAKGAVVQLTKSLASAWARDQIQVNCILPGWIDTDMTRRAREMLTDLHDRVVERTPAGRWGETTDLAGAAIFLCSRASDFVTGVALPVDGGFSSSLF